MIFYFLHFSLLQIETVALYTTPLRFSNQPASNLATCVKIIHGRLDTEIKHLNDGSDRALLGTSALLLVLYPPEIITEVCKVSTCFSLKIVVVLFDLMLCFTCYSKDLFKIQKSLVKPVEQCPSLFSYKIVKWWSRV